MGNSKYLQKGIAIWFCILTLPGCSIMYTPGDTVQASCPDLRVFREDCSHKNEQIAFLRSQLSRYGTKVAGDNSCPGPAMIRTHIKSLETWCPR